MWDACSNALITFHKDQSVKEDPLAYIAENDVILAGIAQRLDAMGSDVVQVKYSACVKSYRLTSLNAKEPWVEVNMEDGQTLRAKLLVRTALVFNCCILIM